MTDFDHEDRSRPPDNGGVRQAASTAVEAAGGAVGDTVGTAREQAGQVAGEAKAQARNLAREVRDRVGAEARSQNDRLADGVRRFADELDEMAATRGDSPASNVVTQVSQGGRRIADYLAEHGPDGLLEDVQDFARRRPGTFLLAAAAAGFVVGRLGKGVLTAGDVEPAPATDARLSGDTQRLTPVAAPADVPAGAYTGYPATGTAGVPTEPIPASPGLRP
jgi:hypothetical protein